MEPNSRRDFLKLAVASAAAGWAPTALFAATDDAEFERSGRALLAASARGDLDAVRKLVRPNPRLLSVRDAEGRSPFAIALLGGHRAVSEELASVGYACDLHEAALAGDWARFESLAKELSVEAMTRVNSDHPIGGSAMFAAATGGAGSSMWRVYAQGGDPNCVPRNKNGVSPLQGALRFRDLATAEMTAATLLSNDANPNPGPNADTPPLHIAAERGSAALVEMLIRLGADVRATDKNKSTATRAAEAAGHAAIHRMIEQHEAIARTCRTSRDKYDVNFDLYRCPDTDDLPILERRAVVGNSHRNLDKVRDSVKKDRRFAHGVATTSEKCVEAAAHMGRRDIADLLLDHGAPYSLPTAVMRGDVRATVRLLDEDPNRIHERGAHDFALLWYPSIGKCDLEMTQLLLDRGAKVEEQHYLGTTALHWACRRGPIELVELLIAHGADVNRVGRKFGEPESPLQTAQRGRDPKITKLLQEKGAR